MRSDIMRRLEKLEADRQAKSRPAVNYGARLTEEEWLQALAMLDPDPEVAFAMMTAEDVPAAVCVVGLPVPPASFAEMVAADAPAHFWTARMAAWALAYKGKPIHDDDDTVAALCAALDRLLPPDGASERVTALRSAILESPAASEGGPIMVFDLVGISRRPAIQIEVVGADVWL
ncbi:hypothetical protein [Jiella sonneratiae]|uniref:Uncharacterized protein n=1 Tax=Jiella sonneratiae TaxID=2816856 RepID=A0ABS3J2A0_9HYPH|nr:hypothetical protein [Jiella sonneratiae]MBO0903811.1 hypothetical protein [Jiella sonneratiae]